MAIRNSRPPRLPCAKGAVSRRLTEGLSGVDGPFGDDLCRNPRPFLPSAPQTLALRRWPGWSMQLSLLFVGADAHIGPSLGTTGDAPVGRGDHTPPPGCSPRRGRHRSAPIPVGSQTLPTPHRGGPMCPPGHSSSRDPHPGRHTGRPLQIRLQPPSTPGKPGGDRAPPLPGSKAMNAQDRFEIYQATPKTKTPCMTAGPPVPIPHPPSQRKKTPPSVSEQGFPKGGAAAPLWSFQGGRQGGNHRVPTAKNFAVGKGGAAE